MLVPINPQGNNLIVKNWYKGNIETLQQALRVPEPPFQSTVAGLIKYSQTNISGDTEHLSK